MKKSNKKNNKKQNKINMNKSKKHKNIIKTKKRNLNTNKKADGFLNKLFPKNINIKTVVIKDTTPFEDRLISKHIHNVVKRGESTDSSKFTKNKSFSPQVNKRLASINTNIEHNDIFGCGINTPLKNKQFKPNVTRKKKSLFNNNILVKIGMKNNNPICVNKNDPRAQKILLDNLNLSRFIDCNNIVPPLQIRANCWFNTMFVCFFISDKGRKFFKFFRQLMIQGKLQDGRNITPKQLADSFFLFNAAIEASYSSTKNINSKDLALSMDTNNIITRIYNSIPKNKRGTGILDVDSPNNPLIYYKDIINYLGNNSINLSEIYYSEFQRLKSITNNGTSFSKLPDVYAVILTDEMSKNIKNRPIIIKLQGVEYILDSAIIRDTEKYHFCAVLTCGGKELGFDGASMSRLNKFEWKKYINTNRNWTFEGSNFNEDKKNPILWNFRKGYQILFYYRN
tara:strand:+ start:8059 stop:9417 length:1359 start_codon:yes stop_codon:yes gene_type:complete